MSHLITQILTPRSDAKIDPLLESQFAAGRLYATISSRPGQSGRADGYILEGKELEVSLHSCQVSDVANVFLQVLCQENKDRQAKALNIRVGPDQMAWKAVDTGSVTMI